MVDYTGDGDSTFTLPATSDIIGRKYYILSNCQSGENVLTLTGSGGTFLGTNLEGPQTELEFRGTTPQSVLIVSTGNNWFLLHDGREHE